MASLDGIKIKLKTNSQWWASSSDRLYLGIHSTQDGREFRLNLGLQFTATDTEFEFGLGRTCCDTNLPTVNWSTNGGQNDPLYSPIELSTVQHVYLRKEDSLVDPSPSSDDDALLLDSVEVLLCDVDGNLRKFSKKGPILFSDETGLQHWLANGKPPRCEITMSYDKIEHFEVDGRDVGNKWTFEFAGYAFGNKIDDGMKRSRVTLKPGDTLRLDRFDRSFVNRCCGSEIPIIIWGYAREHDWPGADDVGQTSTSFMIQCSKEPQVHDGFIDVNVSGRGKNKSRIRMHYRISAKCVEGGEESMSPEISE